MGAVQILVMGFGIYRLISFINQSIEEKFDKKECDVNLYEQGIALEVNGKSVSHSHGRYYFDLLNLSGMNVVNDETIHDAFLKVKEKKKSGEYNSIKFKDLIELRAARQYYLDRWSYLASLN